MPEGFKWKSINTFIIYTQTVMFCDKFILRKNTGENDNLEELNIVKKVS